MHKCIIMFEKTCLGHLCIIRQKTKHRSKIIADSTRGAVPYLVCGMLCESEAGFKSLKAQTQIEHQGWNMLLNHYIFLALLLSVSV